MSIHNSIQTDIVLFLKFYSVTINTDRQGSVQQCVRNVMSCGGDLEISQRPRPFSRHIVVTFFASSHPIKSLIAIVRNWVSSIPYRQPWLYLFFLFLFWWDSFQDTLSIKLIIGSTTVNVYRFIICKHHCSIHIYYI